MFRAALLACAVGVTVAAPGVSRTQEEIDDYRTFLERAKPNNATLEELMAANPKANAWESSGKYQGDIILNEEQIESMMADYAGAENRNGWLNRAQRWPGNTIIWDFAAGHFTVAQQQSIIATFTMFHTRTCVRFRRRTNEKDYVLVTGRQDGCYATVGYWAGAGAHTMNLARGCFNHFIIIHEWLHVVGFMHMHQAYVRYNYIWINWQNVDRGMENQFELNPNNMVSMLGLPYEYASNQHYGPYAFSFNGQPTIGARWYGGDMMGQLEFVTGLDIHRIGRLYNCPGAWSSPVRAEDANRPAYYEPSAEEADLFVEQYLKEENITLSDEKPTL